MLTQYYSFNHQLLLLGQLLEEDKHKAKAVQAITDDPPSS